MSSDDGTQGLLLEIILTLVLIFFVLGATTAGVDWLIRHVAFRASADYRVVDPSADDYDSLIVKPDGSYIKLRRPRNANQ